MRSYTKDKNVLVYCFQVWITILLLCPVVGFILGLEKPHGLWDFLALGIDIYMYEFIFGLPALLFFIAITVLLFKQRWPLVMKHLMLSLSFFFLAVGTISLFTRTFYSGKELLKALPYTIPIYLIIRLFDWPTRMMRDTTPTNYSKPHSDKE